MGYTASVQKYWTGRGRGNGVPRLVHMEGRCSLIVSLATVVLGGYWKPARLMAGGEGDGLIRLSTATW